MEIFSASDVRPRVQSHPVGKSRTKQSFREESEITNILKRYVKTGIADHMNAHSGEYGFASSVDFHQAMNVVTKADQMFEALPAELRKRFNGAPGEFLDFVQNPENQEEMIKLGLATRTAEVERKPVVAAAEAESAPITPEVVVDPPGEVAPAEGSEETP